VGENEHEDELSTQYLWGMLLTIVFCLALIYAVGKKVEADCEASGGRPQTQWIGNEPTVVCVEEMEDP
jgi:hypothetical protein